MGRFAQILGVGVKGGVEIELPKQAFFPGEQIVGNLKLVVTEAVHAESFELVLSGKEHLGWHRIEEDSNEYTHVKHVIFKQEIQIISSSTVFQPGEYIYPFVFQLPVNLPGSHSVLRMNVQYIRRVTSSIMYKVQAKLKAHGMKTADLGGERIIGVHALPKFAALPPVPKRDTLDHQVTFMCCFGKGRCEITGAVSTSVVDLLNGFVRVQGTVKNNSTVEVTSISVRLYQDWDLHIPQGYTEHGRQLRSSRCLFEHQLPGLAPGDILKDIVVDIAMPPILARLKPYTDDEKDQYNDARLIQQPFNILPLMPTTDAVLVSVGYNVAIECAYVWCPDAKLELPTQLHIPPFAQPVVPLPMGTASPERASPDKDLSIQSIQ